MKFKSIRTKLIVSICSLTILLVLVMQVINIIMVQSSFSKLVPENMEAGLKDAHLQIQSKLDANFAALDSIASMPYVRDTSVPLADRAESLAAFVDNNASRGYQACAITDTKGNAVLSFGVALDVSIDDYFQRAIQGERVVSDPFLSRATGNLLIIYAVPYYDTAGNIAGVLTIDVDAYHLSEGFSVQGLGESAVAFALAQDGTTVVSTGQDAVGEVVDYISAAQQDPTFESLADSQRKMHEGKTGSSEHNFFGKKELMRYMPIEGTTWSLAVVQSKKEAFSTVNAVTFSGLAMVVVVVLVSIVGGTLLARSIARPIQALVTAANSLAVGDTDVEVDVDSQDEIGTLANAFRSMAASTRQQVQAVRQIADGDYTVSLPVRSEADIMSQSLNEMVRTSNRTMGEVRDAAEQVAMGAEQIADGSQVLSAGSVQQATALEEFSASVEEVHGQANANAELANSTVEGMNRAEQLMGASMASMQEMNTAMDMIEKSSQGIEKVMKVIDDIAFQTNILALNAAVEAARAGTHGKGFAVVADEVRNLAGKSAEAANESAALIQSSIENVMRGVKMVEKTSQELGQVGEIVKTNTVAMDKISAASRRQSEAIAEIDSGIAQVAAVVQANSATAEESAAAAQQLSSQSTLLNREVSHFKLRAEDAPPSPAEKQEEDQTPKDGMRLYDSAIS